MKQAINIITGWIGEITELLVSLLIVGVIIGLLFNDPFGVIHKLARLMQQFGQEGLAGLVALVVVLAWYKK
jgi:hypothetical protein